MPICFRDRSRQRWSLTSLFCTVLCLLGPKIPQDFDQYVGDQIEENLAEHPLALLWAQREMRDVRANLVDMHKLIRQTCLDLRVEVDFNIAHWSSPNVSRDFLDHLSAGPEDRAFIDVPFFVTDLWLCCWHCKMWKSEDRCMIQSDGWQDVQEG